MLFSSLVVISLGLSCALPSLPEHEFVKKIQPGKKTVTDRQTGVKQVLTVTKVFVSLVQGPYVYKRQRERGDQIQFTCNGWQELGFTVQAIAHHELVSDNLEEDIFTDIPITTVFVTFPLEFKVFKSQENVEDNFFWGKVFNKMSSYGL